MRHSSYILFAILLLSSCQDEGMDVNFSTGLVGSVKYGRGDCMPGGDFSSRVFNDYDGDLYFIVKSDLENLGEGDFDVLKGNSIQTTIRDGKMAIELPVDTFLVMPPDVYLYSDQNTVIIQDGVVLKKNFKFWKCVAY